LEINDNYSGFFTGEVILCNIKDKNCFVNKSVAILIKIAALLFSTKLLIYQHYFTEYFNIQYLFNFIIKEKIHNKCFHCRNPPFQFVFAVKNKLEVKNEKLQK